MASPIWRLFQAVDRAVTCKRCGREGLGWVQGTNGRWYLYETTTRHPLACYSNRYVGCSGRWANKTVPHTCYAIEVGESFNHLAVVLKGACILAEYHREKGGTS